MKVLVATEKPFAAAAVNGIRKIVTEAGHEITMLEKYPSPDKLIEAVADADALIVRSDKVTADVVAAAGKLKIVVRAGAGYDNIDLAACSARGIVVMNTPGQNSNAVAELAIAMMIFMSRNQFTPGTGSEIKGKKVGIHAYGNVGRLVAETSINVAMPRSLGVRQTRTKGVRTSSDFSTPTGFRAEIYEFGGAVGSDKANELFDVRWKAKSAKAGSSEVALGSGMDMEFVPKDKGFDPKSGLKVWSEVGVYGQYVVLTDDDGAVLTDDDGAALIAPEYE